MSVLVMFSVICHIIITDFMSLSLISVILSTFFIKETVKVFKEWTVKMLYENTIISSGVGLGCQLHEWTVIRL